MRVIHVGGPWCSGTRTNVARKVRMWRCEKMPKTARKSVSIHCFTCRKIRSKHVLQKHGTYRSATLPCAYNKKTRTTKVCPVSTFFFRYRGGGCTVKISRICAVVLFNLSFPSNLLVSTKARAPLCCCGLHGVFMRRVAPVGWNYSKLVFEILFVVVYA